MAGSYSDDTRAKILKAAHDCFSKSGYNGTSVREIVVRAGTNIASVNYHFGGKEALYKEIVETSFEWIFSGPQLPVGDDHAGNFDQYIRAFVRQKILDTRQGMPHAPPRLMGWEIVDPKLDVKNLMDQKMEMAEENLVLLLSPLFGEDIGTAQKRYAARWFFTFINPPPHLHDGFWKMLGPDWREEEFETAISQVATAAISVVKNLTSAPTKSAH